MAATAYVWAHLGNQLSAQTDIVGSTTAGDFDVNRYLDRFYSGTLLLPAVTIVAYLLLRRWGPLRVAPAARSWPPLLAVEDHADSGRRLAAGAPVASSAGVAVALGLARALPVAVTVFFEVDIAVSRHGDTLIWAGLLAGAGFLLSALGLGWVLSRLGATRGRWGDDLGASLSAAHALLSPVVVALLVAVSASTGVTIRSNGHVAHYPWFPWWIGGPATAVAAIAIGSALFRSHAPITSGRAERLAVLAVVTPVLLFVVLARLPGDLGFFRGFDDAQSLVGANLMFHHGLWPWKDIYLLHGFLYDGVFGAVGMWLFSTTRWASVAGTSLLVEPITWIVLFGFLVYFSRRRPFVVVAGVVAIVSGVLPGWGGTRYVPVPIVLLLFDWMLRRGSWTRAALFMLAVVLTSIVTPQTTILMLGVLGTLVVSELVHRERGRPLKGQLRRSIRCLLVGTGLVVVWLGFLAATNCLTGFVDYFRTTISGHQYWGAFTPKWDWGTNISATTEFLLPIVLFLATVAMVVSKLLRRTAWHPSDWVLVASATFVPVFYQVSLDRLDVPHVNEVFQTVIPFVVLWAIRIVFTAEAAAAPAWARVRAALANSRHPVLRSSGTALLSALALVAVFAATVPSRSEQVASRFHAAVPRPAPSVLPFGYLTPGRTDIGQIEDLGTALARYAGANGPVFDFTNEMGITYFLLDRVPGARYYHVESAESALAQEQEVADLRHSRPRVVIFSNRTFGIPGIDGLYSTVRNYLVSQYLLDNYTPLMDVEGQLLLIRNDLAAQAPPPPRLLVPPLRTDLYFRAPECSWGKVPNFLVPPPRAAIEAAVAPILLSDTTTHVIKGDSVRTLTIAVPYGTRWTDYKWMEFDASGSFGLSRVVVTDNPRAGPTHEIRFNTVSRAGPRLFLRVGSCLQWHGYRDHISIVVRNGASDLSVHLLP